MTSGDGVVTILDCGSSRALSGDRRAADAVMLRPLTKYGDLGPSGGGPPLSQGLRRLITSAGLWDPRIGASRRGGFLGVQRIRASLWPLRRTPPAGIDFPVDSLSREVPAYAPYRDLPTALNHARLGDVDRMLRSFDAPA